MVQHKSCFMCSFNLYIFFIPRYSWNTATFCKSTSHCGHNAKSSISILLIICFVDKDFSLHFVFDATLLWEIHSHKVYIYQTCFLWYPPVDKDCRITCQTFYDYYIKVAMSTWTCPFCTKWCKVPTYIHECNWNTADLTLNNNQSIIR